MMLHKKEKGKHYYLFLAAGDDEKVAIYSLAFQL